MLLNRPDIILAESDTFAEAEEEFLRWIPIRLQLLHLQLRANHNLYDSRHVSAAIVTKRTNSGLVIRVGGPTQWRIPSQPSTHVVIPFPNALRCELRHGEAIRFVCFMGVSCEQLT